MIQGKIMIQGENNDTRGKCPSKYLEHCTLQCKLDISLTNEYNSYDESIFE